MKLKVLGVILATVAALLVVAVVLLNTSSVQNWLIQKAVAILKEQLQTEVRLGHVSISLTKGSVVLNDVEVDDRQGRKMVRMASLAAGVDGLWNFALAALKGREMVVTDVTVTGLKAVLCSPASPTDSTANYQFLIDAMKTGKPEKPREAHDSLSVNLRIASATIGIDSLCFTTDKQRPRHNVGKPHHGAFDTGHLDIVAAMTVKLENITDSGLHVAITDCRAADRGSGLLVDSLQLLADIGRDSLRLSEVSLRLPHTRLSFDEAQVLLPDTTAGRTLQYHILRLDATTELRDIAQPFAPVLHQFTTPLRLQCAVSGDADGMRFSGVTVATADRNLRINAAGHVSHWQTAEQLHVHFDVDKMTAIGNTRERIINHFPVKKLMMKQLRALGRINYHGHFDVTYKKEAFAGQLRTGQGTVNFRFAIDERTKYLNGTAHTNGLELGRVMDIKDLGRIACRADFRFDISKPRTAKMRRTKGGKLPIGNIQAEVESGRYKFINVRNVAATVVSDGAEATGKIVDRGKLIDLTCNFTFTDTDQMHKLKIKPGISFHKKNKSDKKK